MCYKEYEQIQISSQVRRHTDEVGHKRALSLWSLGLGPLAGGSVRVSSLRAHALLAQSCPPRCEPMDGSPPGSSVCGILQARILERLAGSSPGGLPNSGTEPRSPALQAGSLLSEPPGKPFSSLGALQTLSFWGFMGTLFRRHCELNHWPLALTQPPVPLPPGKSGVGTESFSSLA